MYCSKCGSENSEDAAFCNSCGVSLNNYDSSNEKKTSVDSKKTKKKISLGIILSWLFGSSFLLSGISFILSGSFGAGIPLLVASFIIFPPITKWIENKFDFTLSRGLRVTLVIVLFFIYAVNVPPEVTNNDQKSSSMTENQPTYYSKGEKVTVGDITYIVDDVYSASSLSNGFMSKEADGIFLIVDLTIENVGDDSTSILPDYCTLVDSKGRKFSYDSDSSLLTTNLDEIDKDLFLKQLQPGLPTKGEIIFQVPIGESFVLEVSDSLFKTKQNTKYITIGST